MSTNEDCKPANDARLQEGHQPVSSEKRGYQVALDKGYQPIVQTSGKVQPPPVGTTAVIPSVNSHKTPVAEATGKK